MKSSSFVLAYFVVSIVVLFTSCDFLYAAWWPNARVGVGPYIDLGSGYSYMQHPGDWFEYRNSDGKIEDKQGYTDFEGYGREHGIDSRSGGYSIGGGLTFVAMASIGLSGSILGYDTKNRRPDSLKFRFSLLGIGLCSDIHYLYSNYGNMFAIRYGFQIMAPGLPNLWLKAYFGRVALITEEMEFVDYYESDEENTKLVPTTYKTKNDIWTYDGRLIFPSIVGYFTVNKKDSLMVEIGGSELAHDNDNSGFYGRASFKVGYIFNIVYLE